MQIQANAKGPGYGVYRSLLGSICDCPQDHSRAYNPTLEPLVGDLAPDLPWGFVSFGGSCPQA